MTRRYRLSEAEKAVIELLLAGKSIRQVAVTLGISPNTVNSHMKKVRQRIDLPRNTQHVETAREARRRGLV